VADSAPASTAGASTSGGGSASAGAWGDVQPLDPLQQRFAREIVLGLRHLHERELERKPWVAALAHILHGHREQVHEPQHRGCAKLARLRAQAFTGVVRHRDGVRHLSHVLDEHEVA
jgi:hypothetical protein